MKISQNFTGIIERAGEGFFAIYPELARSAFEAMDNLGT